MNITAATFSLWIHFDILCHRKLVERISLPADFQKSLSIFHHKIVSISTPSQGPESRDNVNTIVKDGLVLDLFLDSSSLVSYFPRMTRISCWTLLLRCGTCSLNWLWGRIQSPSNLRARLSLYFAQLLRINFSCLYGCCWSTLSNALYWTFGSRWKSWWIRYKIKRNYCT